MWADQTVPVGPPAPRATREYTLWGIG